MLQVGIAVVVTLSHIVLCFASAIITLNLWGGWFSVSRALDPSAISNGTNTTDASTSYATCVPWASACV